MGALGRLLGPVFVALLLTAASYSEASSNQNDSAIPKWWSPFQRLQIVDPLASEKCIGVAPGFDPAVLKQRDAMKPIKTLEDLQNLKRGQDRVLVVASRFGLGNTLRNWVSAFYWSLVSGRKVVLLHGGKHHGVYTSFCLAFNCPFDHIRAENDGDSVKLLDTFQKHVKHADVALHNAVAMLHSDEPVVFSYSYAFWDTWWRNNRTLAPCVCSAVGYCHGGGGYRAAAMHALMGSGPSKALGLTVQQILKNRPADLTTLRLPVTKETRRILKEGKPMTDLSAQFDIGLHIRTRPKTLEMPGRPFGRCRGEECAELKAKEEAEMKQRFTNPELWDCFSKFVRGFANPNKKAALNIFLATDNMVLREDFIFRLSSFGTVYFNNGSVAHVGVSTLGDAGRLPTMAEFYLMGKSHVLIELDSYMSTFSQFSALLGNNSLISLPRENFKENRCARPRPAQVGVWRKTDPRKVSDRLFKIEK